MAGLETSIVLSVACADRSPRQVALEFRGLLANGARLAPAGEAKDDPGVLLRRGYGPRHRLDLFDARLYLARAKHLLNSSHPSWIRIQDLEREVNG